MCSLQPLDPKSKEHSEKCSAHDPRAIGGRLRAPTQTCNCPILVPRAPPKAVRGNILGTGCGESCLWWGAGRQLSRHWVRGMFPGWGRRKQLSRHRVRGKLPVAGEATFSARSAGKVAGGSGGNFLGTQCTERCRGRRGAGLFLNRAERMSRQAILSSRQPS